MKTTVPQSVFESPMALRIAKEGHALACEDLAKIPRDKLDKGNPNHPDHDFRVFGYTVPDLLAKQYK